VFHLVLTTLCLVAVASAPAADVADRVRQHIAAADAARASEAAEAAAMAEERLRAEAALALLTTRAEAERRRIAELDAKLAEVEAELDALSARDAERLAWEAPLGPVLAAAGERIAAVAVTLPPGVLPPAETADEGTAQALIDLQRRLSTGLNNASTWSLGVEEGTLDGEPRAVNLLRCGAVACWWSELDGDRAGSARFGADGLVLLDAPDEAERRAIRQAVAIAGGRASPELVDLPLTVEGGP